MTKSIFLGVAVGSIAYYILFYKKQKGIVMLNKVIATGETTIKSFLPKHVEVKDDQPAGSQTAVVDHAAPASSNAPTGSASADGTSINNWAWSKSKSLTNL